MPCIYEFSNDKAKVQKKNESAKIERKNISSQGNVAIGDCKMIFFAMKNSDINRGHTQWLLIQKHILSSSRILWLACIDGFQIFQTMMAVYACGSHAKRGHHSSCAINDMEAVTAPNSMRLRKS